MRMEPEISGDYVVFVSSDGEKFHLTRAQCAMCLNVDAMLTKLGPRTDDEPIELLLAIKEANLIKRWFNERTLPENTESLFRLLKAADFLVIEELTNAICNLIINLCDRKKLSEIKAVFCVGGVTSERKSSCPFERLQGMFEPNLFNGQDPNLQKTIDKCRNYYGEKHSKGSMILSNCVRGVEW